jgi:RES domain-containing protein
VVYASSTKSLAALESLVHLNPPVLFKYLTFGIEFDDALLEKLPGASLPPDWQTEPPPPSTKSIGDEWVRSGRTAVLAVPSVILSGEPNLLLNPAHPDFQKIRIAKPERFAFDPRLLA